MKPIAILAAALFMLAAASPVSAGEARWGWSQIQSGWAEAWADLGMESWIVAEHEIDGSRIG